ncbi:hypothetical protein IKQ21_04065 [bacterium]|nr:hypothetical protein [bacterium]
MRVLPVNINRNTNPSHKANNRWVTDKLGNKLYMTSTVFFRDDVIWEDLIKYLCERYKNVPKVNFVNYACSNGMETLSFAMSFLMYAPEEFKKFTPIIAKDINEDNILMAKQGVYKRYIDAFLRMQRITNKKCQKYLDVALCPNDDRLLSVSPKKILTDNIIYKQGDIFEDIENIPKYNTFLTCRNFWQYISFERKSELAKRLSKRLNPSSIIMLGECDVVEGRADLHLELNGFKRCPCGMTCKNILYSKG